MYGRIHEITICSLTYFDGSETNFDIDTSLDPDVRG